MSASEIYSGAFFKVYRKGEANESFEITRDQFVADRKADVRGTANPSVMNNPFWISQAGPGGLQAWNARIVFGNAENPFLASEDPVWCFSRFGATYTKLPDGRVVCIGGEHEDGYDPDFCIYNDVVVIDAPRKNDPLPLPTPECIKIYGYPIDVFPLTDFHTSTYCADPKTGKEFIFIIGGLDYADQASRDRTDVYRLDLSDFRIHRVETSGAGPIGGTRKYKAELLNENEQSVIRITTEEDGSSSTRTREGKELVTTKESKVFTLRIHDMRWI